MRTFWHDLRYAARTLRNSPAFATIGIVTLALGIAINTAIFSVINGLLLRPLPVPHPEQIVVIGAQQGQKSDYQQFSYPDYEDIRNQADVFSDVMAYRVSLVALSADGKGDDCVISRVSSNYFSATGIRPALGRLILPTEGRVPGADPVLVLGYNYWQKRFGGDKNVIGKQVELDHRPVTIVGVTPKNFPGLFTFMNMDAYVPLSAVAGRGGNEPVQDLWTHRDERSLSLDARLKPGVGLRQANAALQLIAQRIAAAHPDTDKDIRFSAIEEKYARPGPDPDNTIPNVSLAFTVLGVLVLLVACFNIANVLLVRATVRQREMAIRAAIGAGRARLIRQYLTESLLLALLGGVAGLLLGSWASGYLGSLKIGAGLPIEFHFQPDIRVYLFTLGIVLVTAVVVGVLPALRVARTDVNTVLREGGRGSSEGRARNVARNTLVVAQLAGSMLLLIVAGLFLRSLTKAENVYLGFNPNGLVNVMMDIHEIGYEEPQGREFFRNLQERISALPGVTSVTQAFSIPMGLYSSTDYIKIPGRPVEPGQPSLLVFENMVTPKYFETLQIPLKRGREFRESDNEKVPHVAIVNETMAARFWPGEDVVGKHFQSKDAKSQWVDYEIIGVAQNGKYKGIVEDPMPFLYECMLQNYTPLRTIQVRASVPPETIESQIGAIIREMAPGLPFSLKTMKQDLEGINGYLFFSLGARITATMGLLGLILAVVGVYSVVSYSAAQRTHEIGVRMALGAEPKNILNMVLRQSLLTVAVGLAIGLGLSLAGTRALADLLVGVTPTDPLTFAAVAVLLTAVALFACWIPAHRATRVDPLNALRYE